MTEDSEYDSCIYMDEVCDDELTDVSFEHPILGNQVEFALCSHHLEKMDESTPGQCGLCKSMPDHQMGLTDEITAHLCQVHAESITQKFKQP